MFHFTSLLTHIEGRGVGAGIYPAYTHARYRRPVLIICLGSWRLQIAVNGFPIPSAALVIAIDAAAFLSRPESARIASIVSGITIA